MVAWVGRDAAHAVQKNEGGVYHSQKGMEALERSKGFIRNLLAKKLKVRKCPELHFVLDTSLEYGNKIESIINSLHEKD